MATLHEYFLKDGHRNLTMDSEGEIRDGEHRVLLKIVNRIHLDFEARARYVSIYIPRANGVVVCPRKIALTGINDLLNAKGVEASCKPLGDRSTSSADLIFTGRIYVYSEDSISDDDLQIIHTHATDLEWDVRFRFTDYAEERSKMEKPLAFISHDSRDSKDLAEPLALKVAGEYVFRLVRRISTESW